MSSQISLQGHCQPSLLILYLFRIGHRLCESNEFAPYVFEYPSGWTFNRKKRIGHFETGGKIMASYGI